MLSPTNDQMWGGINPICTRPAIVIKNNGSTTLTSLTISYGITGATPSIYNWIGNLKFMETDTVRLDTFAWMQGATTFTYNISSPNGGVDEYPYDNTRVIPFTYVPVMPTRFVIVLRTNNDANEDFYTLKDDMGNTILYRIGLIANHIYNDTVNLPAGCYEFRLTDLGEDGLQWWANTAQGAGFLRFASATNGLVYKYFGADFGGEVYEQFTVSPASHINEYAINNGAELNIYPNPSENTVNIDFDLPAAENGVIEIRDVYGKKLQTYYFAQKTSASIKANISGLERGVYFVTLRSADYTVTKKMVHQ